VFYRQTFIILSLLFSFELRSQRKKRRIR